MQSVFLMMTSVILFSVYPLLAALGLNGNDPILFVFMTHLACAVFSFACAFWMLKGRKIRNKVSLDAKTWMYVGITGLAAGINHACLMYAFLKIPKISAAIIYETWPIMAAWLMPVLVAKGWEQVRKLDYVFGLLAFAGIAFIACADARNALLEQSWQALREMPHDRMVGYGLAIIASIGVAISTTLRRVVTRTLREKYKDDLLTATCMSSGLTRAAALPVFIIAFTVFGINTGQGFSLESLPLAAFTGIAVHLMGSLCYALSIIKNPDPPIPVPDFVAPILAVTWLYVAGLSELSDFAVIGGLFVITANLLITVRAEDNFAYTASILTLLLGGAWCYFTRGTPLPDFYDAVSVSAVFYAILIAFAWDRVLERTKREETIALEIAHDIEWLRIEHHKDDDALIKKLVADVRIVMETTDRHKIGEAYWRLQKIKGKLGERQSVIKIFHDLDSLILSKTKDIMLSEVVLLCLIGGVTFFGILGFRPPGLWPDMMAFIMAGAIVFIFFAIFDQMTERNKPQLMGSTHQLCIINDEVFADRHEFKLVTIVLIGIMLAVFYGLFRFKYGI